METWSRAMTSGRQVVDTQKAVPNRYNTCFASICPRRCEQRTVLIVCLVNALTSSLWTDSTRHNVEILHWAPPSMCLPCVYLMEPHVTRSPRPSPTVFHTESDERPGNEASRIQWLVPNTPVILTACKCTVVAHLVAYYHVHG